MQVAKNQKTIFNLQESSTVALDSYVYRYFPFFIKTAEKTVLQELYTGKKAFVALTQLVKLYRDQRGTVWPLDNLAPKY